MWTDTRQAIAWAFGWLVLVTAGFVMLRRPVESGRSRLLALPLPVILLLAGLVRLIPVLWLPVGAGYDIESYRLVTDALLGGKEVYTSVLGRHPYLPFQMYIMAGSAYLSQVSDLPYVAAIKLPAVLADVALTGLIYYSAARNGKRVWAVYLALLYALNPVSLLVTSYHGQFEAITLFLLVLAWQLWDTGGRERSSAAALGFAVLNKTWPIVFLPVIFIRLRDWRARIVYTLIALGIPVLFAAAYLIIFSADPMPMLRRALTHRGVAGYWGPGAILNPAILILPKLQSVIDLLFVLRNWLLLAAVLFALWWTRRQSALDAFLTLLLSMFAVTVGFGIQWLVWLVPFAILAVEDRWLKVYTLAGTLMLTIHLFGLHMTPWLSEWLPAATADWIIRWSALPAWSVVIAWTFDRLRRAQASLPAYTRIQENPVS